MKSAVKAPSSTPVRNRLFMPIRSLLESRWRACRQSSSLGFLFRKEHIYGMSDDDAKPVAEQSKSAEPPGAAKKPPREIGGPTGPEPTRYGDWERNGRCTDF
jgi:hypothetical protein